MPEKKRIVIIVHSGTLDRVLCVFILSSTVKTMHSSLSEVSIHSQRKPIEKS